MRKTKTGTTAKESAVSCHERRSIATTVESTVTTFESTEEAVFVTTLCTPPTSFWRRDCNSPVRAPVKKRSDIACRCSKSRLRRSCITFWPTTVVRYVCAMPITPETSGTAIITSASSHSRWRLWGMIARLMTAFVRKAGATPRPEVTRMLASTTATCHPYGLNRRATRRTIPFDSTESA